MTVINEIGRGRYASLITDRTNGDPRKRVTPQWTATSPGRRWGMLAVAALTGLTIGLGVTGCSLRDRICSSDEYPVKAVGNTTGRTCVPNGEEPPTGYVRYPADKMPRYVDDEWDKYWRTVTVDKFGHVVSLGRQDDHVVATS